MFEDLQNVPDSSVFQHGHIVLRSRYSESQLPRREPVMIHRKVIQKAEELMKKADLPEMMKKAIENGPPLGSWMRDIQSTPKK